jgi:hypothetical protein
LISWIVLAVGAVIFRHVVLGKRWVSSFGANRLQPAANDLSGFRKEKQDRAGSFSLTRQGSVN